MKKIAILLLIALGAVTSQAQDSLQKSKVLGNFVIGTMSAFRLGITLANGNNVFGGNMLPILNSPNFPISPKQDTVLFGVISAKDLGEPKTAAELLSKAGKTVTIGEKDYVLALCEPEDGPQIRLQWKDQSSGDFIRLVGKPYTDTSAYIVRMWERDSITFDLYKCSCSCESEPKIQVTKIGPFFDGSNAEAVNSYLFRLKKKLTVEHGSQTMGAFTGTMFYLCTDVKFKTVNFANADSIVTTLTEALAFEEKDKLPEELSSWKYVYSFNMANYAINSDDVSIIANNWLVVNTRHKNMVYVSDIMHP